MQKVKEENVKVGEEMMSLPEEKFMASLLIHDIKGKRKCEVCFPPLTPWLQPLLTWPNGYTDSDKPEWWAPLLGERPYPRVEKGAEVYVLTLLSSMETGKIRRGRRKFPPRVWPQAGLKERIGICWKVGWILFFVRGVGRIMAPKDAHALIPEPVTILYYMAKAK